VGCVSADRCEDIEFAEEVPLDVPLFEFVTRFDRQLRAAVAKPCDVVILQVIG